MKRVNDDDCTFDEIDGGGYAILLHNGEKLTGISVFYYDTGEVEAEQEYVDGYLEGWFREYYKNGKLKKEYKTHNNVLVAGTYSAFDENGNKIASM
jgi:antitoxin component YwqK of YwqJK toxin-antitoxin module